MQPVQLILWRRTNKLSQKAAAEHLGIARRTYLYYEAGERSIPDELAAMILATPDVTSPEGERVPLPTPGETSETHSRYYRRISTKRGYRIERIPVGHPVSDGAWLGRIARPPGRTKEDDEVAAILQRSQPKPTTCEHCGSALAPTGECSWDFCPARDDD